MKNLLIGISTLVICSMTRAGEVIPREKLNTKSSYWDLGMAVEKNDAGLIDPQGMIKAKGEEKSEVIPNSEQTDLDPFPIFSATKEGFSMKFEVKSTSFRRVALENPVLHPAIANNPQALEYYKDKAFVSALVIGGNVILNIGFTSRGGDHDAMAKDMKAVYSHKRLSEMDGLLKDGMREKAAAIMSANGGSYKGVGAQASTTIGFNWMLQNMNDAQFAVLGVLPPSGTEFRDLAKAIATDFPAAYTEATVGKLVLSTPVGTPAPLGYLYGVELHDPQL